jgi:hypothetical protein
MITEPAPIAHSVRDWKERIKIDPWVPVTRCSDSQMWYAREVGQTHFIERVDSDGLWAREPVSGCINIIRFEDADF